MSKNQYRTALEALGLSQGKAAAFLGYSIRQSHAWANGEAVVPVAVAKLLRLMLAMNLKPEHVH
jgi:DNA-binding transcriptional regulator YiaG